MKARKKCLGYVLLFTVLPLILTLVPTLAGQERKGASAPARKQAPSTTKKETVSMAGKEEELSQDKELRERAYSQVINALADVNDIENKTQAAHLRADLAGLICAYGERAKAIEVFRQSINDIVTQLLEDERKGKDEKRNKNNSSVFELALQLANDAIKCDPTARSLVTKDLENLRITDTEQDAAAGTEKVSENIQQDDDPSVVPDEMWGTQPSTRRRIAAQILTKEAHEKIDAEKPDEAEVLLRQSLKYCVTTPFVTALSRLMKDRSTVVSLLFIQAAHQVQTRPSGAEVRTLNFGLRPLGINPLSIKAAASQRDTDLVEGYLSAVTALVLGKDNVRTRSSSDTVRMVKAALPLYASRHPETLPLIESWVREATNGFSSATQHVIEKSSFAAESSADKVIRYEGIALNSKDLQQQDQASASLASVMIQDGKFDKAAEWATKISETSLRQEMFDDLIARQMSFKLAEVREDTYFSVSQLISGVFSPSLRAHLYIQLAKAITRYELAKAEDKRNLAAGYNALQEATVIVGNLKPSSAQSHLLFNIASTYAEFDAVKALTALREAAQSIGRHEDQPASQLGGKAADVTIVRYDSTGTFSRTVFNDQEEYKKPYDLSIFRKLALVNFDIAWLSAMQIEDKLLQTAARYEVYAAILLDRKGISGKMTKVSLPQERKGNGEKK